MFRVNGSTRIGLLYRLIVYFVMVIMGLLAGLQPLFEPRDSVLATMQAAGMGSLQLCMSLVGFTFQPDADWVISHFIAAQFLLEGISTYLLATASIVTRLQTRDSLEVWSFAFALVAMFLPIITSVEERCVTPLVLIRRKGKAHKLSFASGLYILGMTLRRQAIKIFTTLDEEPPSVGVRPSGRDNPNVFVDADADATAVTPSADSSALQVTEVAGTKGAARSWCVLWPPRRST